MSEDAKALAEAQSAEVINVATVHAEAIEKARHAQTKAATLEALQEIFKMGEDSKRFVDVSRIPFICKNIEGLYQMQHEQKEAFAELIREIKKERHEFRDEIQEKIITVENSRVSNEAFWPVKTIVYGLVALALTTLVGALFALVIVQPE